METTVTTVPSARIRTLEVASHIGETVRVAGWLHSLRRLGGLSFLVVRDGWGIVQAVVEKSPNWSQFARRALASRASSPSRARRGESAGAGRRRTARDSRRGRRGDLRGATGRAEQARDQGQSRHHPRDRRRHQPASRAARDFASGRGGYRWVPQDHARTRFHRDPDAQAGRLGDRGRRERLRASTTSTARPIWRRARSSTSRSWSASSSASSRSGRSSAPSRTTPCATSTSTSASTWRWASSTTICTVMAVLREVMAGIMASYASATRRN